jgi:hypothetical protein
VLFGVGALLSIALVVFAFGPLVLLSSAILVTSGVVLVVRSIRSPQRGAPPALWLGIGLAIGPAFYVVVAAIRAL